MEEKTHSQAFSAEIPLKSMAWNVLRVLFWWL